MCLIHIFEYNTCGHSTPEVTRSCSTCPDIEIRCCPRLRIIRNCLIDEVCSLCVLAGINVPRYPKGLREKYRAAENDEADTVLARVLNYLTKNPQDSCEVPHEALGQKIGSALSYIFKMLSRSYRTLFENGKTPTVLHRNILLHTREIHERFMIAEAFAHNFPPSRKDCILQNTFASSQKIGDKHEEPYYSICREPYTTEQPLITKCGHEFGDDCLLEWLEENSSCPVCRQEICKVVVDKLESVLIIKDALFQKIETMPTPTWIGEFVDGKDFSFKQCVLKGPEPPLRKPTDSFEFVAFRQKVDLTSVGGEELKWLEEEPWVTGSEINPYRCNSCYCSPCILAMLLSRWIRWGIYHDYLGDDDGDNTGLERFDEEEVREEDDGEDFWINTSYGLDVEGGQRVQVVPSEVLVLERANRAARGRI